MNIGERIKAVRKESKLTQKQLANKVGVAEITIRQYESNKREPSFGQLQKIATCFNKDIGYFIEVPPLAIKGKLGTDAVQSYFAFDDYLQGLGYVTEVGGMGDDERLYLKDMRRNRLYELPQGGITELEKNITSYTKFQIAEMLLNLPWNDMPAEDDSSQT